LAEFVKDNRNKKRSSAEIFVGDSGLRTAYEILFNNVSTRKKKKDSDDDHDKDKDNDDVLRYFYPHAGYHEVATPFYSRLYQFQKSKRIKHKGIATIAFKNSKHFKEVPKDLNLRFVNFPLPGTMDILRDKLLIISWSNMAIGILIISEEILGVISIEFGRLQKPKPIVSSNIITDRHKIIASSILFRKPQETQLDD
jgi:hypothetical protein